MLLRSGCFEIPRQIKLEPLLLITELLQVSLVRGESPHLLQVPEDGVVLFIPYDLGDLFLSVLFELLQLLPVEFRVLGDSPLDVIVVVNGELSLLGVDHGVVPERDVPHRTVDPVAQIHQLAEVLLWGHGGRDVAVPALDDQVLGMNHGGKSFQFVPRHLVRYVVILIL